MKKIKKKEQKRILALIVEISDNEATESAQKILKGLIKDEDAFVIVYTDEIKVTPAFEKMRKTGVSFIDGAQPEPDLREIENGVHAIIGFGEGCENLNPIEDEEVTLIEPEDELEDVVKAIADEASETRDSGGTKKTEPSEDEKTPEEIRREALELLNVKELKEEAKNVEVELKEKATKPQIIEAIMAVPSK